jgi:hypothetical protein
MEFKKDLSTDAIIKLIHDLPVADKQLVKQEIEADLKKQKTKRRLKHKVTSLSYFNTCPDWKEGKPARNAANNKRLKEWL